MADAARNTLQTPDTDVVPSGGPDRLAERFPEVRAFANRPAWGQHLSLRFPEDREPTEREVLDACGLDPELWEAQYGPPESQYEGLPLYTVDCNGCDAKTDWEEALHYVRTVLPRWTALFTRYGVRVTPEEVAAVARLSVAEREHVSRVEALCGTDESPARAALAVALEARRAQP